VNVEVDDLSDLVAAVAVHVPEAGLAERLPRIRHLSAGIVSEHSVPAEMREHRDVVDLEPSFDIRLG